MGGLGWVFMGAQLQSRQNMIMKLFFILLAVGLTFAITGAGARAAEKAGGADKVPGSKLNHVVSFKFKEGADPDKINALVKAQKDAVMALDKDFEELFTTRSP